MIRSLAARLCPYGERPNQRLCSASLQVCKLHRLPWAGTTDVCYEVEVHFWPDYRSRCVGILGRLALCKDDTDLS